MAEESTNQMLRREVLLLSWLAPAFFLFLALATWCPFDPTISLFAGSPVNELPRNAMGRAGAWAAGLLLGVFGRPAYLLAIFPAFLGIRLFLGKPVRYGRKALVMLPAVLVAALLAETLSGALSDPAAHPLFPPGGLAGYFLARAVRPALGLAGTLLAGVSLLWILMALSFDCSLCRLPAALAAIGREIKGRLTRKRDGRAVPARPARKRRERARPAEPAPAAAGQPPVRQGSFTLPGTGLLSAPGRETLPKADLERYSRVIEETIAEFGMSVEVTDTTMGPTVTLFELSLAPGIMPQRINALEGKLAMSLRAMSVRVTALPGKPTVGVEVPNEEMSPVLLSDIVSRDEFQKHRSRLALALGKDTLGKALVIDLRDMPHLLIAGRTGSGKTVCLNSVLVSILLRATPEDVKLMLIDPKRVELSPYYAGIPHLLFPVITESRDAVEALKWMAAEMDRRYLMFEKQGARHIEDFNKRNEEGIPYIVLVIDELADLITLARAEIETSFLRLTQMARSAGIHLIIATQRPSVNVITGVIKSNLPSRIAFQVSSKVDSRTILDSIGAEKLLGRGDMLYLPPGARQPLRAQGCFLSDREIEAVRNFWAGQGDGPTHDLEILRRSESEDAEAGMADASEDPLFEEAVRVVTTSRNASVSHLQRRLKIGFNRSARLVEEMERQGIVGPQEDGKSRQVL